MLGWWTITRASGIGATCAVVGLLLWPFYVDRGETLAWTFAATAAVAGLCGLSVLLITAGDMVLHRRGERIRPVRGFDIVLGLGLLALSLLQLQHFQGQLPA
jgi:hypothetical protein